MKNKLGFTLTEILVALGVIGVVSAMTVPVLSNNWQKSHTTKLHKVYNDFEQSFERYKTDRRVENLYEAGDADVRGFLHNYFKVVKDCGNNASSGCFASSYRTINGGASVSNPNFEGYNVLLSNGAAIAFFSYNNSGTNVNDMTYARIIVDINGVQGPNIAGRDLYVMYAFLMESLTLWETQSIAEKMVPVAQMAVLKAGEILLLQSV